MNKPYYVKRIVCPDGADCGDLWFWVVLGPNTPQSIGGLYHIKGAADEQADLLNDAYQRGHHDGVAEHTVILRNATPADRDEGSEPDPSLCGYVSSGDEAIEAIKVDAREMMGTLARGTAALDRDEGKG